MSESSVQVLTLCKYTELTPLVLRAARDGFPWCSSHRAGVQPGLRALRRPLPTPPPPVCRGSQASSCLCVRVSRSSSWSMRWGSRQMFCGPRLPSRPGQVSVPHHAGALCLHPASPSVAAGCLFLVEGDTKFTSSLKAPSSNLTFPPLFFPPLGSFSPLGLLRLEFILPGGRAPALFPR